MAQIDEVTVLLDELDTRLDRLRALYEQYFVGIEKIEPHVQKKDVERRFQALRKMQLRNTAARFRFQALVQKYTTYLSYWQRITRQIEEGTFKRDVARAQRYGRPREAALRDDAVELSIDDISDAVEESDIAVSTAAPPASRSRVIEEIPLVRFDSSPPPANPEPPTPAVATPPADARAQANQPPSTSAPKGPPQPATAAAVPAPRRVGLSPFGAPGAAPRNAAAAPAPGPTKPMTRRKSSGSMKAVKPPLAPAPSRAEPAAPAPKPAVTTPVASAPARPAEEQALRALYERYRDARRQNGEGEVSFDSVAKQVNDTLPRLAEKYPQHSVSLDVTTKDGKTILRPVVRSKK